MGSLKKKTFWEQAKLGDRCRTSYRPPLRDEGAEEAIHFFLLCSLVEAKLGDRCRPVFRP